MPSTQTQALQWVNYANIASYVLNVAVTYGVGASGKLGPSNAEISSKYQTLVTPAGYAFAIWGVIFTFQLIWSLIQLLPKYRAKEEVLFGVGYYYVWVVVAQAVWTIVFTLQHITLSLIAMVSILIPLQLIQKRASNIPSDSISSYWLLKFPFQIHFGWIVAATLVNFNVVLVACNLSPTIQITSAWLSLSALTATALYYSFNEKWVVPSVLAWASYAIKVELATPKDSIENTFAEESIESLKFAAGAAAGGILVVTALRFLYGLHNSSSSPVASQPSLQDEASDAVIAADYPLLSDD